MAKKAAAKATKVAKKETKRRVKKQKDPNAPKRASSAYILYSSARRASLTKEKPKLDHKQVISELSKEWNALSETDKAPYVKKAEADRQRYLNEMKNYKKK